MKILASINPLLSQTPPSLPAQAPDAPQLRQGFSANEFIPFYQPQVSLKRNQVVGVEVLARWQHPGRGLLTPGYFLNAIERHGMLDELFLRLFEQGLVLRQRMARLSLPLKMSFNLQPSQLGNPMLVEAIKVLLRAYDCSAQVITFEITESGTFTPSRAVQHNLLQLRHMGCGLSMDDFGTGFSSLERLCDIPFTELKLDSSFVQKLDTHSSSTAIITYTTALADALGLSLVIEGVETLAQLKKLKGMGCSTIQGYAIAPPMPDTALLPYMLENLPSAQVKLTSV